MHLDPRLRSDEALVGASSRLSLVGSAASAATHSGHGRANAAGAGGSCPKAPDDAMTPEAILSHPARVLSQVRRESYV